MGFRICLTPDIITYTVNEVSFNMVAIEGGTFTMGGECYHDNGNSALPTHEVTLSNFFIGQTEVTQALYEAVMGDNPSYHIGNLQYPVERVSWDMCQEFIVRLNQLTGKKFRLPTEAEWEFAARGGNKSMGYTYSGSNNPDDVAWHGNNSDHMSHVVGAKLPNELGLYDMSGNVWERVADWYSPYSEEPQYCPTGPENGTMRCTRGGGYHLYGYDAEPVFYRGSNYEYDRHADMGFRICLTPDIITYTVNEVSFNMVAIEGGKFTMGATAEQGSDAESDEYPTHQVTLSGFSIGQTEVPGAVVGSDGEQPERVHR
jgi:formylglycine-generating enzyme required for sulfatase activity